MENEKELGFPIDSEGQGGLLLYSQGNQKAKALRLTSQQLDKVIDVGESSEVRSRVESHDRQYCWSFNANNGQLAYAVYYTPGLHQAGRRTIEQAVRDRYNPPCGER